MAVYYMPQEPDVATLWTFDDPHAAEPMPVEWERDDRDSDHVRWYRLAAGQRTGWRAWRELLIIEGPVLEHCPRSTT